MKRSQFYAIFILALLFVGSVILLHSSNKPKNSAPTNTPVAPILINKSEKPLSNALQTEANKVINLAQISTQGSKQIQDMFGIKPNMTPEEIKQRVADFYHDQTQKMSAQDLHSIIFYGKIVDESNQPLAGINGHYSLDGGKVEKDFLSDASGNFSISDLVGKFLIIDISKIGYYSSKSCHAIFDYTSYQPDELKPEQFRLHKKGVGADLITSQYGMTPVFPFKTPLDGTPVRVDFFNRKLNGEGQMEVRAVKPDRLKQERVSEWSFQISIPDGGFIEHNDEFPFEAPEAGYQPTIKFNFKAGDSNWTETIHKTYYIAFGQPRKYGRIELETQMYWGTRLTYAINPDGSRNLEPK